MTQSFGLLVASARDVVVVAMAGPGVEYGMWKSQAHDDTCKRYTRLNRAKVGRRVSSWCSTLLVHVAGRSIVPPITRKLIFNRLCLHVALLNHRHFRDLTTNNQTRDQAQVTGRSR